MIQRAFLFFALSYCWGDEPPSLEIRVNKKPFLVTPSLYQALETVLLSQRDLAENGCNGEKASIMLWVDAICINQDDDEEKSLQVERMDQVYGGAYSVLVWLGIEADSSQMAIVFMRLMEAGFEYLDAKSLLKMENNTRNNEVVAKAEHSVCDRIRFLRENYGMDNKTLTAFCHVYSNLMTKEVSEGALKLEEQRPFLKELCDLDDLLLLSAEFWPAFFQLMARPWFTRVWTLQEARLARHVIVFCGKDYVEWDWLLACQAYLFSLRWIGTLFDFDTVADSPAIYQLSNNSGGIDLRIETSDETFLLKSLLKNLGIRKAKDPRDYVYGLRGMLSESTKAKIIPNYASTPCKIYTCVVKIMTERQGGVGSWCELVEAYMYTTRSLDFGLPSWCPDFSNQVYDRAIFYITPRDKVSHDVKNCSRSADCATIGDDLRMEIPIIPLDEIEHSATICAPPIDARLLLGINHEKVMPNVGDWTDLAMSEECQSWYIAVEELFTAQPSGSETMFKKWLSDFLFRAQHIPDDQLISLFHRLRSTAIKMKLEILHGIDQETPAHQDFNGNILLAALGIAQNHRKYFFVTKQKRIGFSSRPVSTGNSICYVPGSVYLTILSHEHDEYITNACVEGFMGDSLADLVHSEASYQKARLH